jgi:predicted tellurium resistance membrane protein TerC
MPIQASKYEANTREKAECLNAYMSILSEFLTKVLPYKFSLKQSHIIFSLDSVITAVGVAKSYEIMAAAVIIAVLLVMLASDFLSKIINSSPKIKIFALSFLFLVAGVLLLEGIGVHVSRPSIFFTMGFAIFVQLIFLYSKV